MGRRRARREVTAWHGRAEWEAVRELVVARHPDALRHIRVWAARVARLPAGVETTHHLLEAATAPSRCPLAFATALNRFLNHISHLGLNLWGLSKLHEAAAALAVPEWVVQVRHETTHGAMPGLELLWAGLQFGLSWLDRHYWQERSKQEEVEEEEEDELGQLLELYMYLRVYQGWGTERVCELESQQEVLQHLAELWPGPPATLTQLTLRQAVGRVKTEICNTVDQAGETGLERLAATLASQPLLVPDSEFLDSLAGEQQEQEEGEVGLPVLLVEVWADMVQLVDRGPGAVLLISHLLERAGAGGPGAELAAAWVALLGEGLLGRLDPRPGTHRTNQQLLGLVVPPGPPADLAKLHAWLERPGPLVLQLTPLLCDLAGLQQGNTKRTALEQLVRAAGVPAVITATKPQTDPELHTGADLAAAVGLARQAAEPAGDTVGGWQLDTEQDWAAIPVGGWPGQVWERLWVKVEGDPWAGQQLQETSEEVPQFEVGEIDWSGAVRGAGRASKAATPHFYSNAQATRQQERRPNKRIKRH